MKKARILVLCFLCLLFACFCVLHASADDNATTGDGDAHAAARGYGWYRERDYLWKVSLYAGKADTSTRTDPLKDGFYRLGTVIVRNTGWDLPSSVSFGCGTKTDYLEGMQMAPERAVTVYTVENCPAIPIVCEKGDLSKVKSFFGSTGTAFFLLNAVASDRGRTAESMLSEMSFTIGGRTKSGWDPALLLPDGENNRIPWAVVYEPVIVLRLKDGKTRLAFTATEFALAQKYGWYDWHKSGGKGQWVDNLTHRHMPTSVLLEESWFGYPVFPPTDGKVMWEEDDIVSGGGWGMRFLPVSVMETPAVDYFTLFSAAPSFTVGREGTVRVKFCNALEKAGTTVCRILLDGKVLYSETKTFSGRGTAEASVKITLNDRKKHILRADVHASKLDEDLTPEDNIAELSLTAKADASQNTDYGCLVSLDGDAYAGKNGTAFVTWTNAGNTSEPVVCELYYGDVSEKTLVSRSVRAIDPKTSVSACLIFAVPDGEPKLLTARINYANRGREKNPDDNISTTWVFPLTEIPEDEIWEFALTSIAPDASSYPEGGTVTVTVEAKNNSAFPQTDIPLELLVNGQKAGLWYMEFPAYGTVTKTVSFVPAETGRCVLTARVNWILRETEKNPSDNSRSAAVTVRPDIDFAVSGLIFPDEFFTSEPVSLAFRAENRLSAGPFYDVPVEVLEGNTVVWTGTYDFLPESGYDLFVSYPSEDASPGPFRLTTRVRWEDRGDETDPDNNAMSADLTRTGDAGDILVQAVHPNAPYVEGTDVVSSFRILNRTGKKMSKKLGTESVVRLTVSDGKNRVLLTKESVAVCPENDANLFWFRWTVPGGTAGKKLSVKAEIVRAKNMPNRETGNDSDMMEISVVPASVSATPDTRYERIRPSDWNPGTAVPGNAFPSSSWTVWEENASGGFERKTYLFRASVRSPSFKPDDRAFAAVRTGDNAWTLPSGYGIEVLFDPDVSFTDDPDAVTGWQTASVLFPEYGWSSAEGLFAALERSADGKFVFRTDESGSGSSSGERLHFLPLWMPDGEYVPVLQASDCWTPAGKLSVRTHFDGLTVEHSAYDGWYLGRG